MKERLLQYSVVPVFFIVGAISGLITHELHLALFGGSYKGVFAAIFGFMLEPYSVACGAFIGCIYAPRTMAAFKTLTATAVIFATVSAIVFALNNEKYLELAMWLARGLVGFIVAIIGIYRYAASRETELSLQHGR